MSHIVLKSLFIPFEVNYRISVSIFFLLYKSTNTENLEKSPDLIKILKKSRDNCIKLNYPYSLEFENIINVRNKIVHSSLKNYDNEAKFFLLNLNKLKSLIKIDDSDSIRQFELYVQYVETSLLFNATESDNILFGSIQIAPPPKTDNSSTAPLNVISIDEISKSPEVNINNIKINTATATATNELKDENQIFILADLKGTNTINKFDYVKITSGKHKDREGQFMGWNGTNAHFLINGLGKIPISNRQTVQFIKSIKQEKSSVHIEDEWEFEKELGHSVYKSKKKDGLVNGHRVEICAIKKIELKDSKLYFSEQVNILDYLYSLDCKYSVEYYGYGINKRGDKFIYMGYIDGAISLKKKLELSGGKLEEWEILLLATEIANGLKEIHNSNIIHHDIKEDHILLLTDKNGERVPNNIVFIDFGVSKQFEEADGSRHYASSAGPDSYIAPEVRSGKLSGRKSDIYSLGCTFIKMAGGDLKLDNHGVPIIPDHLSNRFKNIIQRCIITNENARFDIHSLLNYLEGKKSIYTPKPIDIELSIVDKSVIPSDAKSLLLSSFNQPLVPGLIPDTVKHLSFKKFNQEIDFDAIPLSVTYLDLGGEFDIQANGGNLPLDSILTLICGFKFTKVLNQRSIPSSVIELQLPNYNQALNKNSIPLSVITLKLGSEFSHFETLSNLPPSIINLEFGTTPEKAKEIGEIVKIIPKNITSLIINGTSFR